MMKMKWMVSWAIAAGGLSLLSAGAYAASLETAHWQGEIDRTAAAGGGVVRVTAGRHRVGSLFLKSNVTLEIPADAVLEGSTNIADYADIAIEFAEYPEPWQSLIAAVGQTNVAVVGAGEIMETGLDSHGACGLDVRRDCYSSSVATCGSKD